MGSGTEVTEEQIRKRAFELWQEHGGGKGYESEFWLHAERELKGVGDISPNARNARSGGGSDGPGRPR